MLLANSVKNSLSSAYNAKTPRASFETIKGRMAIENIPRSMRSLVRKTVVSPSISLSTMALFSLTARAVWSVPSIGTSSRNEKLSLMSATNSGSAPADAIGTIFCALRSTTPIQAILKRPCSMATSQASLKSRSRSCTRTMSELIPLRTAYTRFKRLILCSDRFWSVMSSPILAVPITSPATERSTELFQRMSRRSPERDTISFSWCQTSGELASRSAKTTAFTSRLSGGMKSSIQSLPMTSACDQPVMRSKYSLQ